jgi:uncharacterized membrane protein YuzA (DUF378 family)
MKLLDLVTAVLLLIGGLNWGLVGFFNFNVISTIFSGMSALTSLVYALIGLSALYEIGFFVFGSRAMRTRWCETSVAVKH